MVFRTRQSRLSGVLIISHATQSHAVISPTDETARVTRRLYHIGRLSTQGRKRRATPIARARRVYGNEPAVC